MIQGTTIMLTCSLFLLSCIAWYYCNWENFFQKQRSRDGGEKYLYYYCQLIDSSLNWDVLLLLLQPPHLLLLPTPSKELQQEEEATSTNVLLLTSWACNVPVQLLPCSSTTTVVTCKTNQKVLWRMNECALKPFSLNAHLWVYQRVVLLNLSLWIPISEYMNEWRP